jgi:glycogen synthase
LANGLFLYGNGAKDRLILLGFDKSRLHVIYNSLDYANQICIRKELSQEILLSKKKELFKNYDLPVIIFIGRLTKQKKLEYLMYYAKNYKRKVYK